MRRSSPKPPRIVLGGYCVYCEGRILAQIIRDRPKGLNTENVVAHRRCARAEERWRGDFDG